MTKRLQQAEQVLSTVGFHRNRD